MARREHEVAWVVRASEVMVTRLQDEVEWALDRRDAFGEETRPPEAGARLDRPDLLTCARRPGEIVDRRVTFFGPASVVELFTYPEVRKQLRGRYPKHAWPEDPLLGMEKR